MKKLFKLSVAAVGLIFITNCSSMHPPTTEPYFPGFHARNADKVEQEYDDWRVEQEVRQQRMARQDSLMDNYYSQGYPHTYDRYDFYYSPRYRYLYPHHSRSNFGFNYSTHPPFVDPWWAYDSYWDSYYWNRRYYDYYDPYFYSRGYYSRSYYHSPYYWRDYNYGHYPYYGGGSGGGSEHPQVLRPRDRDSFGKFVNGRPVGGFSPSAGGTLNKPHSAADERKTTPAVIDRSRFRHLDSGDYQVDEVKERPVNRGFQHSRYSDDSDDNARSSRRSSSSRSSSYGSSSSSSSRSYGTSSRSSSSSSSSRSSSASSSRSSGSSSSESSGSSSRSRNRSR